MLLVPMLLLFREINSVSLLSDLGTVYLYPDELYQTDLYQYFNGSFINFTLSTEDSDIGDIKNNWSLASLSNYPNPISNEYLIISTYSESFICYAISIEGLYVNLFLLSITSGYGEFFFQIPISSTLKSAKITQASIHEGFILVIVNGQEEIQGLDFDVNEVYFTAIIPRTRKVSSWDLKFVKNLKMKFVTLNRIFFWGSLYGQDVIFICNFDLHRLNAYQQITQFFEYGSNEPIQSEILDLSLYLDYLIVLQKDVGIVVYIDRKPLYIQSELIVLRSYGRPVKFSNFNNQLTSLMFFGISMDTGLLMVEYRTYRIKFLIKQNLDLSVQVQVLSPYVFIFHESKLEIYYFFGFSFYTLHAIPFSTSQSVASVSQNLYGYSIIKLNHTKIEFLSLNFTLSLLEVRGKNNSSVEVMAEDEKSCVSSRIYVKLIENLYETYMINNYRQSFPPDYNIYFDSLKSIGTFNVFETVSGWNLSVSLVGGETELIKYNFTESLAYKVVYAFKVPQEYSSGFYYISLYLINSQGVFCNGTLIFNRTDPLDITGGNLYVSVLYPGLIMFYQIINQEITYLSIDSNCSNVFKFDELYTICADNEKFILISGDDYQYSPNYYSEITNNEQVVDASVLRDSLSSVDYVYLLTEKNLYFFIFTKTMTLSKTLNETGKFVLSFDPFLFVIGSSIKVYSTTLDTFYRSIPLPAVPSSVFNHFYAIYAQIDGWIYIINGLSPVIQSLVALIPAPNCQIYNSFDYILSLCGDSGFLYTDDCKDICYSTAKINFYLKNASDIDEGKIFLNVSANVSSLDSSMDFEVFYGLYTYSFFLSFNDSEISKKSYYYNYNKEVTWDLTNDFEGFDLEYQLIFNDSIISDPSFPIQLRPRVQNQAYLDEPEYIFIDHDIIPGTGYILVLCQDSVILLSSSVPDAASIPYNLTVLKTFPQYTYTFGEGNCYSINYVSSKNSLSLFMLNCNQTLNHENYYRSEETYFATTSFYFVFLEFDKVKLEFNYLYHMGFNHRVDWINIVTSSSSCFLVLCIDAIDITASIFSINNNLFVYSFVWQEKFSAAHLVTINFVKLNIERLQIISVDGVYLPTSRCGNQGTIFLYISDLFYGIRVVKVVNKIPVLQSSIYYHNEKVVSIAVCGNSVFALSNLTFIDEYFFSKSYNLSFYQTIPPSLNYSLLGFTSFFSCSTYYRPHYLATYFISNTSDYYQLRLIDMNSPSFASYFKFIDIPSNGYTHYKGKTKFINESTFTVLGINNGQISTYSLSEAKIIIESMTNSEYNSLLKTYKTSVFNVSVMYSNKYLTKNTSNFIIGKVRYDNDSSSSSSSFKTWWIWVIASIVLVTVAVSAFLIYKRVMNKKLEKERMFKTIASITELTEKGRLVLLINHEDSFNS